MPEFRRILAVCALFACGPFLNAQTMPADQQPEAVTTAPLAAPEDGILPAQKIGPGDLLSLSVANSPELTRNFRVSPDGTLTLPLLTERIQAAGKVPEQVEQEISQALMKDQILVHPVVSVAVAEYRSVPVTVTGAVHHPVTFQAVGKTTLLDAISKADGLDANAAGEILVTSPAASGGQLVRRVSVQQLVDGSDSSVNLTLYGGEVIRVPTAGRVYVLGNVKKPGAFPIQDGDHTTVLEVLALTEGLAPYANKEAYIYRKESGKNGRDEIPIPLTLIMERKAPDVRLQANDIFYVPDNKGRRLTAETLERISGFGLATASGLLIFK
ncbi:MAG: polysaccharide biosynthesis/export family protein [Acidobacteriaceae bacterium]|nr:polysaccharide biosynthesis/export family protein [Acidobacteriaceae bacterium]